MTLTIGTVRNPWQRIREAVSDTDTLMTAAGAGNTPKTNWDAKDSSMGVHIPQPGNGVIVSLMGNTEGKQVTTNIWVYREFGPAEFVISGTWTIGAREVVKDPTGGGYDSYLYADTFVSVDQDWPSTKLVTKDVAGDDGMAQIWFDATGAQFIKVEVSALSEGGIIVPIFAHW